MHLRLKRSSFILYLEVPSSLAFMSYFNHFRISELRACGLHRIIGIVITYYRSKPSKFLRYLIDLLLVRMFGLFTIRSLGGLAGVSSPNSTFLSSFTRTGQPRITVAICLQRSYVAVVEAETAHIFVKQYR